jgi:hypothetical protein
MIATWLLLNANTPEGREVIRLIRDLQRLKTIYPDISMRQERAKAEAEAEREVERIRAIESAAELEKYLKDYTRANTPKLPKRVIDDARNLEQNRLARRIDARFRKLFSAPRFMGFTTEDGRKHLYFMRFPRPRFPRAALVFEPLERLGQMGLLDRVRQCPTCGLWIFARFERERFCSSPCREKAFRGSAEGKRKRREYMRGYRARINRMDLNNLKASASGRR